MAQAEGEMPGEPEESLLSRIRRRDRATFGQLYEDASPAIGRYVRSIWAAAPVDDIVQETFRRFLEKPDGFTGGSTPETYLIGIARNVLLNYRRYQGRAAPTSPEPAFGVAVEHNAHQELERREAAERLRVARGKIPASQSLAITLAYDQGLVARDAAKIAGTTEKGFRRRLERAKEGLRALLAGVVPAAVLGNMRRGAWIGPSRSNPWRVGFAVSAIALVVAVAVPAALLDRQAQRPRPSQVPLAHAPAPKEQSGSGPSGDALTAPQPPHGVEVIRNPEMGVRGPRPAAYGKSPQI